MTGEQAFKAPNPDILRYSQLKSPLAPAIAYVAGTFRWLLEYSIDRGSRKLSVQDVRVFEDLELQQNH
jgi:hypothetical protein